MSTQILERDKNIFSLENDTLSFEELQNLETIKKEILSGEYYTFNEIFG